jgi:hypothetical protein
MFTSIGGSTEEMNIYNMDVEDYCLLEWDTCMYDLRFSQRRLGRVISSKK